MKKIKTLNVVTPILMTITFLIVVVFYLFSDSQLVSWLTVTFSWVSVIFSWLLYDAHKQFGVVVDIANSSQKSQDKSFKEYEFEIEENEKLRMKIKKIKEHLDEMHKHDAAIIEILRGNNE